MKKEKEKKIYLGCKPAIETQAKLVELNDFQHTASSLDTVAKLAILKLSRYVQPTSRTLIEE